VTHIKTVAFVKPIA